MIFSENPASAFPDHALVRLRRSERHHGRTMTVAVDDEVKVTVKVGIASSPRCPQ